jgi:hypothetical protein
MVRRVFVALAVSLSLVACSGGVPAANHPATPLPGVTASAFADLRQAPLKLPVASPPSCPLSKLNPVGPGLGNGMGSGPIYVFNGEIVRSGHGNKVAWAAAPSYPGPIRIRGGRIGGRGQLLLDAPDNYWRGTPVKTVESDKLYPELDLLESHSIFPNVPQAWRMWPSDTYVDSPGCYAWQVDGIGFTEVIVFHTYDLPTLSAGAACPVSRQQPADTFSAQFGTGAVVGPGPIYALLGEMQGGTLQYSSTYSQAHYKDGWAYSKVIWMAQPETTGDVLIRGNRIDGPGLVGFGMGDARDFTLRWAVAPQSGWASLPSPMRIRAAGCYAIQADSPQGSDVIVFRVVGID